MRHLIPVHSRTLAISTLCHKTSNLGRNERRILFESVYENRGQPVPFLYASMGGRSVFTIARGKNKLVNVVPLLRMRDLQYCISIFPLIAGKSVNAFLGGPKCQALGPECQALNAA